MAEQYGHVSRTAKKSPWPVVAVVLLILWSLMVLMWTIHRIATLFGHHPALGQPFTAFSRLWYWPWAMLQWPAGFLSSSAVQPVTDQALLIFIAPLILAALLYVAANQTPKGRKDLHGTARWATCDDIKAMGYLSGQGVYVGGWYDSNKK